MRALRGWRTKACVTLACLLVLLSACTTRPTLPDPLVGVELGIEALTLTALDIQTVSAKLRLKIANVGDKTLVLSTLHLEARAGTFDMVEPVSIDQERRSMAPGEETSLEAELCLLVPHGTEPLVSISVLSTLLFVSAERGEETLSTEYTCEVPRIMAPELRIASIRILKDELINTKLRVDLEVHNPNAFPVSFCSLDYKLYGEGRYWASDSIAKPFEVLPMETAMARLYMTMNFTDTSRQLLDQVIRLSTVRYRLVGQGSIDTGLEFLPQFVLPFDMSGQTEVLR